MTAQGAGAWKAERRGCAVQHWQSEWRLLGSGRLNANGNNVTDKDDSFRTIFEHWPMDMPRQGIITTAQDTFGFSDFLLSRDMLLIERDRPDAVGSRKIFLPYSAIVCLKLTDPGPLDRYQVLGFSQHA